LQLAEITLANRRPYRVATHATENYRAILGQLQINGTSGYGAGGHCRLTGETEDGVAAALRESIPKLTGRSFSSRNELLGHIGEILADHPSAAAALDMAVWDWDARRLNLPLYKLLAREAGTEPRHSVETDMSIGLESIDDTLRLAHEHVASGFKRLKIKIGHPLPAQEEIVRALRREVGNGIELIADANQSYPVDETLRLARILKDCDFLLLEQPVPRDDLRGLGEVTRQSPLPIFADEAARTMEIITTIGQEKLAHGIVLKLYKHGGVTPTLRAIELAQHHGLAMMISCYSDVSLSIAAAMHITLAYPQIAHIDLDSHLLAASDPLQVIAMEKNRLQPLAVGLGSDMLLKPLFSK
jgi:L-alanine-DL-glutamate epimerase-like enolase superfamily enzyme